MRWVLAAVFGLIGGAAGYFLLGDPTAGGALGRQVAVFSAAFGFVIGAPMGYFVGVLPFFAPQPKPSDKPPKQFAPQVAGGICAICGETILMASDGSACPHCEQVAHLDCRTDGTCPSCKQTIT